ncbi:MAG: HemK/PrmC family methyltransferase, partial [Candidatus Competibacter denitrificans]
MSGVTLGALLADAADRLAATSETARLDAEILLAAALGRSRSYLLAWPDQVPNLEQTTRFNAWLERRLAGEPVAYLLGRREFWSLDLVVTAETLIPRPETELLVELALARLPMERPVAVADLGTGSGAIALALAVERPLARIVA